MVKYIKILTLIFIISFPSCKNDTKNNGVITTESCILEINESYKIHKVTYTSHSITESYCSVFTYYNDSIVVVRESQDGDYHTYDFIATYYIGSDGLADSCDYRYNPSTLGSNNKFKSYFTYDPNGYLKSNTLLTYGSTVQENIETYDYDYTTGNLTKVTYDPRYATTGKYAIYTYNSDQNQINLESYMINLESFRGSWLGKSNQNLVQTMTTYGAMSDKPSCQNYEYTFNQEGLVETKTITSCEPKINNRTIITYKYEIIDF